MARDANVLKLMTPEGRMIAVPAADVYGPAHNYSDWMGDMVLSAWMVRVGDRWCEVEFRSDDPVEWEPGAMLGGVSIRKVTDAEALRWFRVNGISAPDWLEATDPPISLDAYLDRPCPDFIPNGCHPDEFISIGYDDEANDPTDDVKPGEEAASAPAGWSGKGGRPRDDERTREILDLVAAGLPQKAIASRLGMKESAVQKRISRHARSRPK